MKIALDTSPLETGHKVRGIGFYLTHLKEALEKYYPEEEYQFFTDRKEIRNAEIIHFPYFEPFFSSQPLQTKKNMVTTIHDLTPLRFPEHFPAGLRGNLTWQLQRFLVKQGGGIITDSENSRKDIIDFVGVPESFVHVVYLAAGEKFNQLAKSKEQRAKSQKLRTKYKLPERFALYVGDVTWNKNLPRIIKAAEKAGVPLVLVGKAIVQENIDKNNPWNKDFVEVQRLLKETKNTQALGFVSTDDLVHLYNLATVFVMPSLYEGFGLPILEAMSCGTPVVTSKEGSLFEVAGDAAYFVDAYSDESIAKGIKEVFESRKLQQELSEKGLQQARTFSWEKTAQETIRVYEQIVHRS